jgi:predicted RNA-binding protein with TRAM domain
VTSPASKPGEVRSKVFGVIVTGMEVGEEVKVMMRLSMTGLGRVRVQVSTVPTVAGEGTVM